MDLTRVGECATMYPDERLPSTFEDTPTKIMLIEPEIKQDNRYTKGSNRMNLFRILTNCNICNSFGFCRKYLGEIICRDCNSEVSKFTVQKISGSEAIELVRKEYAKKTTHT